MNLNIDSCKVQNKPEKLFQNTLRLRTLQNVNWRRGPGAEVSTELVNSNLIVRRRIFFSSKRSLRVSAYR